jgi:hypothetical protein
LNWFIAKIIRFDLAHLSEMRTAVITGYLAVLGVLISCATCTPVNNEPVGPFPTPGTTPYFKKGIGGGGECGDLDEGAGGLLTPTWWYDWGHDGNGFKKCNGSSPATPISPVHQEYVPMIWGKWVSGFW